jgi:lipopolysaccharide transport system permease protein
MILNIIENQKLIWAFVIRDLKGRYIGSVMGLFWSVIHPLSQILVFSIIFSLINRGALVGLESGGLSYTIFLCSGLLPWIAFQEFLMRVTGVFVANSNLIKKVQFPEEILVIQELLSSLITLLISFSIFFIIIVIFGGWVPSAHILLLPGIITLQVAFSLGIAFFMATLNVFLRDIGQIMGVVLLTWFWLTPIVYPRTIIFKDMANLTYDNLLVPRWVHTFITLNPWYYISKWYREIIYLEIVPEFNEVIIFVIVATLTLFIGSMTFKSLRKEIPDMI